MNSIIFYEYTKFILNRKINRLYKLYKTRQISKKVKNDVEKYILENSIFAEYIQNYSDIYGPGIYKSIEKNVKNPEYFYCGLEFISEKQLKEIKKIKNIGIICNSELKLFKETIKKGLYYNSSSLTNTIFEYFSHKRNKKYIMKYIKIIKKCCKNDRFKKIYIGEIDNKVNKIFSLLKTKKLLKECYRIKKKILNFE